MNPLNTIKPNIDTHGYIAQSAGDDHPGADSLHREGLFAFTAGLHYRLNEISIEELSIIKWRFMTLSAPLVSRTGLIRRHVDADRWYSHWDRGSRDQSFAVIGASMLGVRTFVRRVVLGYVLRLGFANNLKDNSDPGKFKLPDIAGPGTWATLIRCLYNVGYRSAALLYPLLLLLDFSILANSLMWCYYKPRDKSDTDISNHLQVVLLSNLVLKTPTSALAKKFLAKMPGKLGTSANPVQECLNDYFQSNNGVTGLAQLLQLPVERYIYNITPNLISEP